MSQKNIALSKKNLIICAVAVVIIILGFVLMTGPSTTLESGFEPDIFFFFFIKIAPIVCLIGFVLMIIGILYPVKDNKEKSGL